MMSLANIMELYGTSWNFTLWEKVPELYLQLNNGYDGAEQL